LVSRLRYIILTVAILICVTIGHRADAAVSACGQAKVESLLGAPPPPGPSTYYIAPNQTVAPFYQWESNTGYCGEVSLMSADLAAGQWISQYNTRMVCGGFFGPEANGTGPSLLQAGNPPGRDGNFNAELLIENPFQGVTGPNDYDWAGRCAANAGLSLVQYPETTGYLTPNTGMSGYRDFMRWIKTQIIEGHQVTIGVMLNQAEDGSDPQYDHIVNVIKIGTNHSPTDPSYYPDDVIYFDDHGVYTLKENSKGVWKISNNPSIPPGAGTDTKGCTPYIFAYTFASFVKTRQQEDAKGAPAYAVVLPDDATFVRTATGNATATGDGLAAVPGPHNTAFAITGPLDPGQETLPVSLAILGTSSRVKGAWVANPADRNSSPPALYNYENPYIGGPVGTCDNDNCISNTAPDAMKMTFQATVHGLTPGVTYNLYEYDFPLQSGVRNGTAAALPIPTSDFNAAAAQAHAITQFTAQTTTYAALPIIRSSHDIIIFRAVPADAP